jgi:Fe-S-cluster containining protein
MTSPSTAVEALPPLYVSWMGELLAGPIPRESRASCDDCAMCAHGEDRPGPRNHYFDPHIKCCTYVPDLHNFLVGRILSDDDTTARIGRTRVEEAIRKGIAVTPLGLGKPPAFSLLYANGPNAFGRSHNLRCPYFIEDGGRCGVWRNRESTCATWFCKHARGKVGRAFWQDALHRLLRVVEVDLARWCVLEIGLSDEALRHLLESEAWTQVREPLSAEAIDYRVEKERYARIWGEWRGREVDFFLRCAQLVSNLSWSEVLEISGPSARTYARLTQEAYRSLTSNDLPPALEVGAFQVVEARHATTRVTTYSSFDPIDVPNAVMALLPWFDRRPTQEVLDAIADKTGIRLDRSLVRKLVDFGVLISPGTSPEPAWLP